MTPTSQRHATVRHATRLTFGMLLAVTGVSSAAAQSALLKPSVAVMEFDNAAMVKHDEFAAMTVGIQVLLTNAIATNKSIDVVERRKIQAAMTEQDLAAAGRIAPERAAAIGKLIGARHILLGAIVVQPNMLTRLSVRSVDTETGLVEYTNEVEGKGDRIFKLIDQLSAKLNTGLKLPGVRDAKAVKDQGFDGPNQLEAMKAISAARRAEENGDKKAAIALYQKSLALNSTMAEPKMKIAQLERAP